MRKSELQVGVEYACFHHRRDVRKYERYGELLQKPFKAKLVDVNFSELRLTPRSHGWGVQYILEPKLVTGIAVDTGKKVRVEGDLPKRNKDDTYKRTRDRRQYITEPHVVEYDYFVLPDAGCIASTWAEHLAAKRQRKEMERERDEQVQAERTAYAENAPKLQATLDAVIARLREVYGVEAVDVSTWHDGEPPSHVYVSADDEGWAVTGDIGYDLIPNVGRVLIGATFQVDLVEFAKLLGVVEVEPDAVEAKL